MPHPKIRTTAYTYLKRQCLPQVAELTFHQNVQQIFFFFSKLCKLSAQSMEAKESPCCQPGLIWNSLPPSDPCASKH